MENPIKMDDLGVPLFSETSIYLKDFEQISPLFKRMMIELLWQVLKAKDASRILKKVAVFFCDEDDCF